MIKTLIIDDDQANINTLQKMINLYCPQIDPCGTATNISDAYTLIRETQPTLIFLDIEMPNGNGFELLRKFERINFDVVFTTAYDQYALEALRREALDYLLKPIDIEALQQAVLKAEKKAHLPQNNTYWEKVLQGLNLVANSKICIPVMDGMLFVNPKEIVRCEASGSYSNFFMVNGKKLTTSLRLKECEELLPEQYFFRTHHSHIINLNYMSRYVKGRGGYIVMEDNSMGELATRKKDAFMDFVKKKN